MGDNKWEILSIPRQHIYDWGKLNTTIAVISSLVSFKLVLNDGRIRKNFYLFRRIAAFSTLSSLTEEVSLALCSILMVSPVLINMQTSCKTATDFSCMACLYYTFKYIHRSQSAAKQSESFYGWEIRSQSSDVVCQSSHCCPSMKKSSVSVPLHGHPLLWKVNEHYLVRDFPDILMVVQFKMSFVGILSSLPFSLAWRQGRQVWIFLFSSFKF